MAVLTTKYAFPRVPQPHWADRETTPEGIEIFRLSGFPRWVGAPLFRPAGLVFSPAGTSLPPRVQTLTSSTLSATAGSGVISGPGFGSGAAPGFVFTPSYHRLPLIRWWLRPINAFLCRVVDRIVSLTNQEAGLVRRDYWAPPGKQVSHRLGSAGTGGRRRRLLATPPPRTRRLS